MARLLWKAQREREREGRGGDGWVQHSKTKRAPGRRSFHSQNAALVAASHWGFQKFPFHSFSWAQMGARFLVSTWQQETPGLYLTDNIPGFQKKRCFFGGVRDNRGDFEFGTLLGGCFFSCWKSQIVAGSDRWWAGLAFCQVSGKSVEGSDSVQFWIHRTWFLCGGSSSVRQQHLSWALCRCVQLLRVFSFCQEDESFCRQLKSKFTVICLCWDEERFVSYCFAFCAQVSLIKLLWLQCTNVPSSNLANQRTWGEKTSAWQFVRLRKPKHKYAQNEYV